MHEIVDPDLDADNLRLVLQQGLFKADVGLRPHRVEMTPRGETSVLQVASCPAVDALVLDGDVQGFGAAA